MRTIPVCCLFLLLAAGAIAQQSIQPIFSHALNFQGDEVAPARAARIAAAPETLHILAAMVGFQEDADTRTSGNGSFDLTTSAAGVIDPAPRDKQYFENHLLFAKNYFAKVSDGALVIQATVLDSVYRLPHPMRHYSPARSSATNLELGNFVQDAWHSVDSVTPGIAYGSYDAFVLFHAGVGRDIDLVSIYGYDPTPYDLPSLYLNLQSLRSMFGSSYDGVSVAGGSYHITSTMVLPETENREVATLGGTALLELSINGLLAASIGSHLGLPDLFDTKTGRSGIGRFGLMDGQSIFSWNGVFPPEPSAWERAYLGWVTPVTVPTGSGVYDLPAVGVAGSTDTVYKALISAKEYFLIENRNRDAMRDGANVTMVRGGVTTVKNFPRDTTGFNAFNQDSLFGVITDVDEFDWSLPGGVSSRTHELFDGGILIWHIDEYTIDANFASATVNADPARRGVDLEEADGSQDIGQAYGFLSAGSGSEDGTALDFWYRGNAAPLRLQSNMFGPNTHPNSLSNDLANSHVTVKDFSARGPRMSARIDIGDGTIRPLPGFPKAIGSAPEATGVAPADLDGDGLSELVVATSGKNAATDTSWFADGQLLAWRQDGSTPYASPVIAGLAGESFATPAFFDIDGDRKEEFASSRRASGASATDVRLTVYTPVDGNVDGAPDLLATTGVFSNTPIGSYVVTAAPSQVVWGGRVNITMDKATRDFVGFSGDAASGVSTLGATDTVITIASSEWVERRDPNDSLYRVSLGTALVGAPAIGDLDHDGIPEIVVVSADGRIFVLDPSLRVMAPFPLDLHGTVSSSPAVADVDGDGFKDIIVTVGRTIVAVNGRGAMLDHFPVTLPTKSPIYSSPVVGDIDGDGSADVCVGLFEGQIAAYSSRGGLLAGFPIQAGRGLRSTPTLFRTEAGKVGIAAATEDRYLYAWEYDAAYDSASMPWPMYLHDPQHSGFEGLNRVLRPISAEFLPASRAYNWPNPVGPEHDFKTHIRYYVGADATVTITIIDQAGDLVAEFPPVASAGGMDHESVWDVSKIQSGVYFARVEASGSGTNGVSVIKIAVVK